METTNTNPETTMTTTTTALKPAALQLVGSWIRVYDAANSRETIAAYDIAGRRNIALISARVITDAQYLGYSVPVDARGLIAVGKAAR